MNEPPITNHESPPRRIATRDPRLARRTLSLRSKLLLLALAMLLVLPWAGWQLLRQMEALLRQGQQQALLASAEALARAVAVSPQMLLPAGDALYVQPLAQRPVLDGAFDDWRGVEPRVFDGSDGQLRLSLALGRHDDQMWLRAEVEDASLQRAEAHWSTASRSDQLWFGFDSALGEIGLRLANAHSGPLRVAALDGGPPALRLDGAWQERARGYRVEWQLPHGLMPERIGLQAIDGADGRRPASAGTGIVDARLPRLLPLLQRDDRSVAAIAPLLPDDMRARLLSADGWLLAEFGELPEAGPADALPWWRRELYQWLLFADDPWAPPQVDAVRSDNSAVAAALTGDAATLWQRDRLAPRLLLSAAAPVRIGGELRGAVLLEREHQTLLLTEQALGGLLGSTLLALLVVGGIVLLFASRLSWRIGRLRDATENALERDGRVRAFPTSDAGDEIGDLSRSFARLLGEIAASQDYLRTLAGKLSHELNTPIAIVRGALDNVDPHALAEADRVCIERARGGADRLAAIVRTMGEAHRIEQAIANADAEDVDLRALVATLADGYRDLLAPRRLDLQLPDAPLFLHCAPELVVQALDKLIDNARGFTPEDGWVQIALEQSPGGALIRVANQGPLLPPAMQHRLFDSMVSLRGERRGGVHLGFGLYVVRLVTELHRGSAKAENLTDADGVVFTLVLGSLPRRR